ncbi:MAG: peptidylprolyl isomerase [Chromatiaceae bacterium]
MKRCPSAYAAFLLVLPLLGPGGARAGEADPILLSDQGQAIRASAFTPVWLDMPPAERARLTAEGGAVAILQQLLRKQLMAAEAERLGLDRTPAVQARLAEAREKILVAALREHVEAGIPLPDLTALARENYAVRQAEMVTQGEYQAAHILLKVACPAEREAQLAKITALKAELDGGADFAELARRHSQDASAQAGGDLGGWLQPEALDPTFVAALVQLEDGAISGPVETPFGFHLIHRLGHRPAGTKPFEAVRGELEQEIRASYLRNRLAEAQKAYHPSPAAQLDQAALLALIAQLEQAPAQAPTDIKP